MNAITETASSACFAAARGRTSRRTHAWPVVSGAGLRTVAASSGFVLPECSSERGCWGFNPTFELFTGVTACYTKPAWAQFCTHADTKPRVQTKTLSAHDFNFWRDSQIRHYEATIFRITGEDDLHNQNKMCWRAVHAGAIRANCRDSIKHQP